MIPKSSCKFSNNFQEKIMKNVKSINIRFMITRNEWNCSIFINETFAFTITSSSYDIKNNPYFTYHRAPNFVIQNWLVLDTVRLENRFHRVLAHKYDTRNVYSSIWRAVTTFHFVYASNADKVNPFKTAVSYPRTGLDRRLYESKTMRSPCFSYVLAWRPKRTLKLGAVYVRRLSSF